MSAPQRLSPEALQTELAKLPHFEAPAATQLGPVRLAIARAVASGQSADEIANDLGMPTGWKGLDLAPSAAKDVTRLARAAEAAPVNAAVAAPPAEWIVPTVSAALAQETTPTTRVVVLDREPTALGGLERPAWARALNASATYGPINTTSPDLQIKASKWLVVFTFVETVQVVRSGVVLCVVPVSVFHFGAPTQASVLAGPAWIGVHPLATTAPADSFAGIAVQSGQITCDQPMTFSGTTVTVPANATVSLSLVPAPSAAGPAGFPTTVIAPAKISATFPPSGTATISFDSCAATLYGEPIVCSNANKPARYIDNLKILYIPGNPSPSVFEPQGPGGKLLKLSGKAHIEDAGWALNVSESTTPETLGTTAASGDFTLVFSKGISARWSGPEQAEPASVGMVLAQNAALLALLVSGATTGVQIEQSFTLWDDQDSSNGRRCRIKATRAKGAMLLYALTPTSEAVELAAELEAALDRPLLATGARVPVAFKSGTVTLIRNNAGHVLGVYSNQPKSPGKGGQTIFPLALDNALLEVGRPQALLVAADTDAKFQAARGSLFLLFGYMLVDLYLPDPYTTGMAPQLPRQAPPTLSSVPTQGAGGTDVAPNSAFLLAEVLWTAHDKATLRLVDTAHTHPATPPATEASSSVRYLPPPKFPLPIKLQPLDSEQTNVSNAAAASATSSVASVAPAANQAPAANLTPMPGAQPDQTLTTDALRVNPDAIVIRNPPDPLPTTAGGATFLDLSTRASQFGVQVVTNERYAAMYTIDGLSVRGPAQLLPLTTLPAIAWEPMYNRSSGDASVNNNTLLHPPGDGPLTQVRAESATLVPISPLQSLQAVLDAGTGNFDARLTLPFGMVAALDSYSTNDTLLPQLSLVRPVFPANSTPSGHVYTGAWQLSIAAPVPSQPDPVLAGRTYLRTQTDNPDPGFSYGEQVLGVDVADIFSSRFDPPQGSSIGTGVPLRRYDLTGYGASTFSEWTNTTPATTDVIKSFFHVLVGRTSHEVIQVQSIIYPWAIKVVRTITIDRLASGTVERYDSGWVAASDGLFQYPADTSITPDQIHTGLISGVINVKNIQQIGLPINTRGTLDGSEGSSGGAQTEPIPVQPVTFDAEVIIQPQHQVTQGGANVRDLNGVPHICVPSKGITGYIGLQYKYHLNIADMAALPALANGAGGPIKATLNVGTADSILRATEFDATPINDAAVAKGLAIACAVRGLPKLSSDGSWSVGARKHTQDAPAALPATQAVPVVQPNKSGSSAVDKLIHFADPQDILRLASGSATPPDTFYGFLQATGTQSNFLSRPILTVGDKHLTLGDALNVAHAGALLGAISNFPGISQCLQFLESELQKITNQLDAPSLATTQNLYVKESVRKTPLPLITTSIADVNLYFHHQDEDPNQKPDTPNVVISLGQPTSPSWSLDVNHVAVGLVIPALSSDPVLWLQGGFHADADSVPAFPDLKVVFDGPLKPLTEFFTILQDIASVLSPGSGASAEVAKPLDDSDDDSGPGLHTHFSDGKLSVSDNFSLGSIPLGPGTIEDVSLNIGTTLNILALSIDFLVGIGTPDAPCHWIVDPLSGTICLQAGILANQMAILIQAGIGLGLAIDLGIASGSASIVISLRLQIQGPVITLMLLLTGQAEVDVLGGLASASITLTAGLGFTINTADGDIGLVGTASVGIHISICWVINISWSGSWTFQKDLPLTPLP